MEHRDTIRQLFKKYTEGTITDSELNSLHGYFGNNLRETELKEHMLAYFAEHDEEGINDEDAWEIAKEARPTVLEYARTAKNSRLVPWKWIIAAAVLLATVSLSLLIYRNGMGINTDNELARSMHVDVPPGTNKATLKLSNGKRIELSGDKSGIIIGDSITYDDGVIIDSKELIEYATLVTPRGGQYQVTLPDGTKVWLNAESSLKYPLAFASESRLVELEGEAYFEVIENKSHLFVVESANQTLKVLGTKFNVNTYEGLPITTLVSGSVTLSSENVKAVTLRPNQQAILSGPAFELNEVNAADYVAWKDGLMILNNATPEEVFQYIERWYNVDVRDKESSKSTERAYINISRNEKLSSVLEALELTYGIHFTVKGKEVIVKY